MRRFLELMLRAGVAVAVLQGGPVLAHHSAAAFDSLKVFDADAVVRLWEYTNPHSTLWVYINDATGAPQLWALEAPTPVQLLRSGWDKSTVKPGDKVKLTLNPLRDGRDGGLLVKLTLADGRKLDLGPPSGPPKGALLEGGAEKQHILEE